MIILDTTVISEAMRAHRADRRVIAWLQALPATPVTTVINQAEVLAGIAMLPPGQRQERLRVAADSALGQLGVCLPLSPECAAHYADIVAARRAAGRPIGGLDALVASVVRETGAQLATRDTADFSGLGLELVNPWDAT